MPSGLKQLHLLGPNEIETPESAYDDWTEGVDWQFLDVCTNLEKLTVRYEHFSSAHASAMQLQAWTSAARHLHIIDCEIPPLCAQWVISQAFVPW